MRERLSLVRAKTEAFLTTHAFEALFINIYAVSMVLMFIWGAHNEFHHVRTTIEVDHPTWVSYKWLIAIARGAGYSLNLNCAIVILLASRLFLTRVRETPLHKVLPLDKSFPGSHVIVAYGILVGVAIHVPFHFAWLIRFNQFDPLVLWSFSMSVLTGVLLLIVFLVMFFAALPSVRKKYFHWFYLTHLIGAALFFILLVLHGMYRKKPETYQWVLGPLIIYFIDRVIRRLSVRHATLLLDDSNSILRPGKVIELRLPKSFNYRAGQYAELYVPSIGKTKEWHPFTIASSPHENTMVFYIKAAGDWTNKLYEKFERRDPLSLRLRGPFGAPAQHVGAYRRVVLISGGIGSTPFAAISKYLHHKCTSEIPEHAIMVKKEEREAENFDDDLLKERVRKTVAAYFNYDVDGEPVDEEKKEEQARFLAETLQMGSFEAVQDEISSSTGSVTTSPLAFSMDDIECGNGGTVRIRRFPGISTVPARLLSYLHSTRVVFLLLNTLVVRFALVCIVAIWRLAEFGFNSTKLQPSAYWAVFMDGVLGAILSIVMGITLLLEIWFMHEKFFFRSGRMLDFLVFLPMSIISTYFSIKTYSSPVAESAMTVTHFAILLPIIFILLSSRMYRSLGSKTLLETTQPSCGCKCAEKVPNVDFIWTTPYSKDDEWLRSELAPLAGGSELRLHRFVTREKADDLEATEEHITSAVGRPNWESLFIKIADKTRSHVDVGVFFCGPHAMGKELKKALRSVEVRSHIRGSYISALTDDQLICDFNIHSARDLRLLRRFGCNVRFDFREENF